MAKKRNYKFKIKTLLSLKERTILRESRFVSTKPTNTSVADKHTKAFQGGFFTV